MEKLNLRTVLYPGCSLEGTASAFHTSLLGVMRQLGVQCDTLRDWNCCGASAAHALNHKLHLALGLRNLALAEAQGFDAILAPCAACYHRLASVRFELSREPELCAALRAETGLNYQGGVAVRNMLDFLVHDVGVEALKARVTHPLSDLKVACYYGCLNTRIPRMALFDDREYPTTMDKIVQSLGAQPVDWSYKTECCGASLFITMESVTSKLVASILKDAMERGADCIAVACPMCQNNLDTKQDAIRTEFDLPGPMPIVFITQLIGLALGIKESELKLDHSFVPFEAVGKRMSDG